MFMQIVRDRRGALMEYAILIGLIAIVVMVAVKEFGSTLREKVNGQTNDIGKIAQLTFLHGLVR